MTDSTDFFDSAIDKTNEEIIYEHMRKRIHDLETVLIKIHELIEPMTKDPNTKWQIHIVSDLCRDQLKRVQ